MDADQFDRHRERIEEQVGRRIREKMERRMNRRRNRSGASGIVLGGIIVMIGLVVLLENMGIIHSYDVWRFWPLLMIAFGLSRLAEGCGAAGKSWGVLIALIGFLILLDEFDLISLNFNLVWPLVLIGFGLLMLWKAIDRRRALSTTPGAASDVSLIGVFSGGRRRIDSLTFRGCDVLAFCGGFEIDLRNATMVDGKATVDINAMFGGVEIFVPENWKVLMKGMGIFGGFEDKTIPPKFDAAAPAPELIVTGYAIFGGASVRN